MANYKITDYIKIDKILTKENINTITVENENYQELLRKIPNVPYLIYVKGIIEII